MKKLISILLAILVIGCLGMEAKTTKKGGKKKSGSSGVVVTKGETTLKGIPSFNKIINTEDQEFLFEQLGYKVTSKTVKNELYDLLDFQEPYITLITATKAFENGATVTYQQDICGSYKMTISGRSELLEKYYKDTKTQVKHFNRKYGDDIFYITVKKQGNNIIVSIPCN